MSGTTEHVRNRADELLDLIDLERIDTLIWRGQNEDREGLPLFGGQVLAQALAAASATVDDIRPCHSLHCYFLRPGRDNIPVVYTVEPIRDGRSFATRRIVAIQKGEAIFSMDASFQQREHGLSHQIDATDIPAPDTLVDDREFAHTMDGPMRKWLLRERPFEIRSVFQQQRVPEGTTEYPMWIRFRAPLGNNPVLQRCLLAYASDMGLVSTALQPHLKDVKRDQVQMASLDHALWFHQDFDVTDWLVYVKDTPESGAGRGFNRGGFYNTAGQLVASVMQEGLMRLHATP